MPRVCRLALLAVAATIVTLPLFAEIPQAPSPRASSADWPGLWGPTRNGIATASAAPSPRLIKEGWRRKVRGGYSEIAVLGDRGYTLVIDNGVDYAIAFDAASGREHWRARIAETYQGHGGLHDGPIATPTVDATSLYAVGPHGDFVALDVATARERWRHDLKRFGADPPTWGFATAPLVVDDRVIVSAVGAKGRGVIAFNRASGALVWATPVGTRTWYSSPVMTTVGGRTQVIVSTGDRLAGLDPSTGRELWGVAGPGDGGSVMNSPIALPDGRVFFSFWPESWMLRVTAASGMLTAAEEWKSSRFRGAHGPAVFRDGYLYGFSGAFVVCLEAATGAERWRMRFGDGTLILVGDELVILSQATGELVVAATSTDRYRERLRARVLSPGVTTMTGPSFARGRLYVRQSRRDRRAGFLDRTSSLGPFEFGQFRCRSVQGLPPDFAQRVRDRIDLRNRQPASPGPRCWRYRPRDFPNLPAPP